MLSQQQDWHGYTDIPYPTDRYSASKQEPSYHSKAQLPQCRAIQLNFVLADLGITVAMGTRIDVLTTSVT